MAKRKSGFGMMGIFGYGIVAFAILVFFKRMGVKGYAGYSVPYGGRLWDPEREGRSWDPAGNFRRY